MARFSLLYRNRSDDGLWAEIATLDGRSGHGPDSSRIKGGNHEF